MDPLTISAASGLRSRMESLEILANNLANASTAGYKKDSESYSLYMSQAAVSSGADADPVTATLPVIERNWTDFSQGLIQPTGNQLDMALSGEGFFALKGPNGPLYTRAGQFRVMSGGAVTSAEGYPVLLNDGTALAVDAAHPLQVSLRRGSLSERAGIGQPLHRQLPIARVHGQGRRRVLHLCGHGPGGGRHVGAAGKRRRI